MTRLAGQSGRRAMERKGDPYGVLGYGFVVSSTMRKDGNEQLRKRESIQVLDYEETVFVAKAKPCHSPNQPDQEDNRPPPNERYIYPLQNSRLFTKPPG